MNEAIIHMYMEMPQGNSLCSSLKQAKMSFFSSFYTKLENKRKNRSRLRSGGVVPMGEGRKW
jgi:hypothetical protein